PPFFLRHPANGQWCYWYYAVGTFQTRKKGTLRIPLLLPRLPPLHPAHWPRWPGAVLSTAPVYPTCGAHPEYPAYADWLSAKRNYLSPADQTLPAATAASKPLLSPWG